MSSPRDNPNDSPNDNLDDTAIAEILATATSAPSLHNTQPWRFVVSRERDLIDLYADPRRTLPVSDPHGRATAIGCGAALFNLRLAVAAAGREPVVRVLPGGAGSQLVASVRIGGQARMTEEERALHIATGHRHTNRLPFGADPIPPPAWRQLAEAATAECATFERLNGDDVTHVLAVTAEADHACAADPARRAELRSWTTADPRRTDGVPMWAFGPWTHSTALPLRDFGLGHTDPARRVRHFEAAPQLAVLLTQRDHLMDWVRAGQALQRILLTATRHGVSASFLHQALEWDHLRGRLLPAADGHVQMVLRLGYPTRPTGATPRRAVADIWPHERRPDSTG